MMVTSSYCPSSIEAALPGQLAQIVPSSKLKIIWPTAGSRFVDTDCACCKRERNAQALCRLACLNPMPAIG